MIVPLRQSTVPRLHVDRADEAYVEDEMDVDMAVTTAQLRTIPVDEALGELAL